MKIYKVPENPKAIIFDIDSTLYTCPEYAEEQIDCQVRQFAIVRGMTADEARKMVADYREKFAAEHNGSKVSLGNILKSFGIPISESVEWRKALMFPELYMHFDQKLVDEMTILQKHFKLICVTNNPYLPARKTLDAIGVSSFFPEIVGLDTCFKSKPAVEPFMTAVNKMGVKVEECIAVGDRYDMDIALPLEMGMGGILVSGVEEVYHLHENVL